jgi:capsular polysaccharide biosynthesis protein
MDISVIRRRWWIVVLVLALALVAAGVATYLMPSRYQSTVDVVVGQGNGLFQPGVAGGAVQPYTATMAGLARSPYVAEQAIAQGHLTGETVDGLRSKLSVSFDPQAALLTLTMKANTPARAQQLARVYATVFSSLVKQRFAATAAGATKAAAAQAAASAPSVAVWGNATYDPSRVSPRPSLNLGIAAIVGLALGLLAAFLREHSDRRVKAVYRAPELGPRERTAAARSAP